MRAVQHIIEYTRLYDIVVPISCQSDFPVKYRHIFKVVYVHIFKSVCKKLMIHAKKTSAYSADVFFAIEIIYSVISRSVRGNNKTYTAALRRCKAHMPQTGIRADIPFPVHG